MKKNKCQGASYKFFSQDEISQNQYPLSLISNRFNCSVLFMGQVFYCVSSPFICNLKDLSLYWVQRYYVRIGLVIRINMALRHCLVLYLINLKSISSSLLSGMFVKTWFTTSLFSCWPWNPVIYHSLEQKNNNKTKSINITSKIYGKGSILLTKSKTLVSKRLAVHLGESEDMYLFSLLLCRAWC